MSFIREPDGIDFVIAPSAYTDEDRNAISVYLSKYKKKINVGNKSIKNKTPKRKTIVVSTP